MRKFEYNPAFLDELGADPVFQKSVGDAAGAIRSGIRGNLPSGRSGGKRVRRFAAQSFVERVGSGRNLAYEVGTKWRIGHLIEFGSVNNPAYAPIRKAARQLGFKYEGE